MTAGFWGSFWWRGGVTKHFEGNEELKEPKGKIHLVESICE